MLTDDDVEDGHVAHDGGDDHGGEGQVPEVEEAGPHLLLQVPGARRGSLQDVRVVVGCQGKQRITITFRVGVIYVHREWVIGYGGQYSLETISNMLFQNREILSKINCKTIRILFCFDNFFSSKSSHG